MPDYSAPSITATQLSPLKREIENLKKELVKNKKNHADFAELLRVGEQELFGETNIESLKQDIRERSALLKEKLDTSMAEKRKTSGANSKSKTESVTKGMEKEEDNFDLSHMHNEVKSLARDNRALFSDSSASDISDNDELIDLENDLLESQNALGIRDSSVSSD